MFMSRKMRKGISPLIAAVLLIAITISIGVVMSRWSNVFVQDQVNTVAGQSSSKIKCQGAALRTTGGQINSTTQNVSLTGENTGTVDLTDFKFNIVLANGTTVNPDASPLNFTLNPGSKQKFTTLTQIGTDPANVTSVRLISKCDGSITIHDDLKGSELSKVT
jgi:flagellin-like protein